jgi:hypothetical protein
MRTGPILTGSLALNALVVVLWLVSRDQPEPHLPPETAETVAPGDGIRSNIVVRRQFFSWDELESEDYPTYIANLRSISCPEETIRDIIIADVDHLFAQRLRAQPLPATQQWWQSEPDPQLERLAIRRQSTLFEERERLLTELLGADWNQPSILAPTVAIKVPLDGPILGILSEETQQAVQRLSGQMQQGFERLLDLNTGNLPDPTAIAALEVQLKTGLRPLLTPSQLEEFMLRFSPTAHRLRAELESVTLFNATAGETRALFRNLEQIDVQLLSLASGPENETQRMALLNSREIAFQNALGPDRYREYQRLQDPTYAAAAAAAAAAGIPDSSGLFYAIERAGQETEARIRANPDLTPLQQEAAIKQMELEQLQAAGAVLGEPVVAEPPMPPSPPKRIYSFARGDNIASISRRTGVPVAVILRANPGLQPENIPIGTQIVIPTSAPPFP